MAATCAKDGDRFLGRRVCRFTWRRFFDTTRKISIPPAVICTAGGIFIFGLKPRSCVFRGLPYILGQTSFLSFDRFALMSMGYEKDGFACLTAGFELLNRISFCFDVGGTL
jgi:hypothetical protein